MPYHYPGREHTSKLRRFRLESDFKDVLKLLEDSSLRDILLGHLLIMALALTIKKQFYLDDVLLSVLNPHPQLLPMTFDKSFVDTPLNFKPLDDASTNIAFVFSPDIAVLREALSRSAYDLIIYCDGPIVSLYARSGYLHPQEAEGLLTYFKHYTKALLKNPHIPVCHLTLTEEWKPQFPAEILTDKTLIASLQYFADLYPEKTFCFFGDEQMSYAQLWEQIVDHARKLENVYPGDSVPIVAIRTLSLYPLVLAVMFRGALPFIIEFSDEVRDRKLAAVVRAQTRKYVLTSGCTLPDIEYAVDVASLTIDESEQETLSMTPVESDLCYGCFTSGSTGEPKVVVNKGNAAHLYKDTFRDDVVLSCSKPAFDAWWLDLYRVLGVGATLVVMTDSEHADFANYTRFMQEHGVTTMGCIVPSVAKQVWHEEAIFVSSLRQIFIGGERVDSHLVNMIRRIQSELQVMVAYGPCETLILVTHYLIGEDGVSKLGRNVSGMDLYLLNEQREPVCPGQWGILYIAGEGYYLNPEDNEKYYITHHGVRLFNTGDLCYIDHAGDLVYVGRQVTNSMLKLPGGVRIEKDAIVKCIRDQGIDEALIDFQEGQLIAYVYTTIPIHIEILMREIESTLGARYVPSQWFRLHKLPLNASGKLNVRALKPDDYEWIPSISTTTLTELSEKEKILYQTLCRVRSISQFDITLPFSRLGYTSLDFAQLKRVMDEKGYRTIIAMQKFTHHNVKTLADSFHPRIVTALARHTSGETTHRTSRSNSSVEYPLTGAQMGIAYDHEYGRHWNAPLSIQLAPDFDLLTFMDCVTRLFYLHPALNTLRIDTVHGKQHVRHPSFTVAEVMTIVMDAVDEEIKEDAGHWLHECRRRGVVCKVQERAEVDIPLPLFNLQQGPFILFYVDMRFHRLIMPFHHIILDGASLQKMIDNLASLYRAEDVSVEIKSFRHYCQLLISTTSSQSEAAQSYWADVLGKAESVPEPPFKALEANGCVVTTDFPGEFFILQRACSDVTPVFLSLAISQFVLCYLLQSTRLPIMFPLYEGDMTSVGNFLKLLPFAPAISAETTLASLIEDNSRHVARGCEHYLPLYELAQRYSVKPELMFSQRVYPHGEKIFGTIEPLTSPSLSSAFTIYVEERGLRLECSPPYSRAFAETFIRYFEYVAKACNPHLSMTDLGLLIQEKEHLLERALTGAVKRTIFCAREALQTYTNPLYPIYQMYLNYPSRIAVATAEGELTYAELLAQVEQWAKVLHRAALEDDYDLAQGVVLCLRSSFAHLVTCLAVWWLGGKVLSTDPNPYRQQPVFVRHLLEDVQAKWIVTDLAEDTAWAACFSDERHRVFYTDAKANTASDDAVTSLPGVARDIRDIIVLFTSGSTGRPKGVIDGCGLTTTLLTLAGILFGDRPMQKALTRDFFFDAMELAHKNIVSLQTTARSFDISLLEMWAPLMIGSRVHLVDPCASIDGRLLQEILITYLEDESIDLIFLQFTPTGASLVWNYFESLDMTKKVIVVLGGEAVPTILFNRIKKNVLKIVSAYGPTEDNIWDSFFVDSEPIPEGVSAVPLGIPLPGSARLVMSSLGGDYAVPDGIPGELTLVNVERTGARGYLQDPEKTAAVFRAVADYPSGYDTGDIVIKQGELIRLQGRKENAFIKINGQAVDVTAIRTAILEENSTLVMNVSVVVEGDKINVFYEESSRAASALGRRAESYFELDRSYTPRRLSKLAEISSPHRLEDINAVLCRIATIPTDGLVATIGSVNDTLLKSLARHPSITSVFSDVNSGAAERARDTEYVHQGSPQKFLTWFDADSKRAGKCFDVLVLDTALQRMRARYDVERFICRLIERLTPTGMIYMSRVLISDYCEETDESPRKGSPMRSSPIRTFGEELKLPLLFFQQLAAKNPDITLLYRIKDTTDSRYAGCVDVILTKTRGVAVPLEEKIFHSSEMLSTVIRPALPMQITKHIPRSVPIPSAIEEKTEDLIFAVPEPPYGQFYTLICAKDFSTIVAYVKEMYEEPFQEVSNVPLVRHTTLPLQCSVCDISKLSFYTVDPALPRTANGKIDNNLLMRLRSRPPREIIPPETEAEMRLVNILSEVLSKPVHDISVEETLGDLAVGSMQHVQLLEQIRLVFGVSKFNLSSLPLTSSVKEIAEVVNKQQKAEDDLGHRGLGIQGFILSNPVPVVASFT